MFNLVSNYKPTGDQPEAIEYLSNGIKEGKKFQTLLGVTGSGKTFTMANIIQQVQKPTYILSLKNSFQITLLNILFLIMITINQKVIFLNQTRI